MTAPGEAIRESQAHVELERWYRRLLWAYPIGYRRSHGDEILTMLMDCAEPGRRVPARADVVDLARGAVRQWFRLPVGLSAVVAAVVAVVVLGAVGAAGGSWLAWLTTIDVPSDAAALRTAGTAAGAPLAAPLVDRREYLRADWRGVQVENPHQLGFPNWTIEAAQVRLQADGWTLGRVDPRYENNTLLNDGRQRFEATRDGLALQVYAYTAPETAGTIVVIFVGPAPPSWEAGAILLGWLVGAITGWFLTGWAIYRLRRRALPRRMAALALGLTALWLAADTTIGLYETLGKLAFTDRGVFSITPAHQWVVTDSSAEHVGGTLAIGLMILALAATGRRRPTVRSTAAAA
jgi:hypothetical protein